MLKPKRAMNAFFVPANSKLFKALRRATAAGVLAGFLGLTLAPTAALALPTGYIVESGDVTFDDSQANTLLIHASDHAIINFDAFSIAQNETVRFIQPFETSSVLSRVTGSLQSDIYG